MAPLSSYLLRPRLHKLQPSSSRVHPLVFRLDDAHTRGNLAADARIASVRDC
jgi:hypothetical protein